MLTNQQQYFLGRAIELSKKGMTAGEGGPFGCVIVKGDEIVGEGFNRVTSTNDPTAHAEIIAIREACQKLKSFQLEDCELYSSCEPCPMCLGAIYWARPNLVVFANTRKDAMAIGFDDDHIYNEIASKMDERVIKFIHHPDPSAAEVFNEWKNWQNKKEY